MLHRLARLTVRARVAVIVGAVAFMGVAGALGGDVAERLSGGGFDEHDSESARASRFLLEEFETGDPNLILLVSAGEGRDVDDPEVAAAGLDLTQRLAAEDDLAEVVSYWSLGGAPPLRSTDQRHAMIIGRIEGSQNHMLEVASALAPEYERDDDLLSVTFTGPAQVFAQMNDVIESDLVKAESLAIPITFVLMIVIFGSVVAALLPMGIGVLAILGTFLVLRLLSGVTEVSIYALNLTTAMGLGLAIDYSLFVLSRYREELAAGRSVTDAVITTVRTAGRTVVFSAVTVAVSLAALMVFPIAFLRSFAYAGIAVVAIAGFGAVVVLPALLAIIGTGVDRLRVIRHEPKPVGEGIWHRIALAVMRRPVPVALGATLLLAVLGLPFLGIVFGLPDYRTLPEEVSSRQALETIGEEFSAYEASALPVVAADIGDPTERLDDIEAFAKDLSRLNGAARVDALTGSYVNGTQVVPASEFSQRFASDDATWLSVVPALEPISPEAEVLVHDIRDLDAPFDVLVTGGSAQLVDSKVSIFSRVPLAIGIIAAVTFVVLFLMFGGLLVPVKAVVLNLLSLSATFGAMVWVFQDGHLSGLLGFTPTGTISVTIPILMFCIAFGLSMDYEVFLLSRIKEEHDHGADDVQAVAVGLERTGRIVTSAAVLIAVVFTAIGTSSVSFIMLFGLGLTLAVLVDAFVIRSTLVPAFMRLAGRANWWAPRPLRLIYERFGISESVDIPAPVEVPAPAGGAK